MGGNNSEIKQQNVSAILLNLLHYKRLSRIQLAQQIGVSTSTITNLVSELINANLVQEEGSRIGGQTGAGRPQRALQLVGSARCGIGVHIDVGKVHVAIVDLCGTVLKKETFTHALDMEWKRVLDQTCDATGRLVAELALDHSTILGVGIAASGLVDPFTGVNIISPNLHWHDVPMKTYLEEALALPVIVENNVRAMALGESLFGSAQGVYSVAFFYARFGVGAGFVVGGQVFRGSAAGAGEVGHTTIMLERDARSGVFKPTCLEDLISEPALLSQARQRALTMPESGLRKWVDAEALSVGAIFEAARNGDAAAQQVIHEYGFHVGIALANLINVFNPELIILGGILQQYADALMPKIKATVRELAFGNLAEKIRIVKTGFEDRAGMIGAAALVLDQYFYRANATITTLPETVEDELA
jgi:predicted NBD/HSP70 family sugar kinase